MPCCTWPFPGPILLTRPFHALSFGNLSSQVLSYKAP